MLTTLPVASGDDIYVLDDLAEHVLELDGEGVDEIQLKVNKPGSFSIADMGEVENVTLTGKGVINLIGNLFDNTLIGNTKANQLEGGDGDDVERWLG